MTLKGFGHDHGNCWLQNILILNEENIRNGLLEAVKVLNRFIKDDGNVKNIASAAKLLFISFKNSGKVLVCGNGGSHCDAMHFCEELTGRYRESRPDFPTIAYSDPGHMSSVSNDFGFDVVFSRYIEALGNKGDVLFCLSTSGNTNNIINVIDTVKNKKNVCNRLDGENGGQIANIADVEIRVSHFGAMQIEFKRFISK